ncbi:MAG: damage-inducible protein J [Sphingobacteriales bacterium]|nr:MAG: damage-inducible protein J [Sphingobacteriales bacterium]
MSKQNSKPNASTLKTFKNTDKNIGLNKAKSVNDLFEKLEM